MRLAAIMAIGVVAFTLLQVTLRFPLEEQPATPKETASPPQRNGTTESQQGRQTVIEKQQEETEKPLHGVIKKKSTLAPPTDAPTPEPPPPTNSSIQGTARLVPDDSKTLLFSDGTDLPAGNCPWTLSFRAQCITPETGRRGILHLGGRKHWSGVGVAYDGVAQVPYLDVIGYRVHAPNKVNCSVPHIYELSYQGTILRLSVDGQPLLMAVDAPLTLAAVPGLLLGFSRGKGASPKGVWEIEVLQVKGQPCVSPNEHDDVIAVKIQQAKQQWKANLAEDPLQGSPRRDMIDSVCNKAEDEEERWMCRRRGRRMAERFESWWFNRTVPISRKESDAFVKYPIYEGGVRFSVVNGEVKSFHEYGGKGLKVYYNIVLPWVADLSRNKVFKQGQTFDFIVVYGDGCQVGWDGSSSVKEADLTYPTTGYSNSELGCPYREPLDWMLLVQDLGWFKPKVQVAWEKLENNLIWKGSLNNPYRLQMMDALTDIPIAKGSGFIFVDKIQCRQWATNPALRLKHTVTNLCRQLRRTPWEKQGKQKYHINIDGWGTALRMLDLLRAPGVVFSTHPKAFLMSWEHDLVPWLHYIPFESSNIRESLESRIEWARRHDNEAKEISEEATRWVSKHGTKESLYRMWELYAVFMAELWREKAQGPVPEPPPLLKKPSSGKLDCDTVGEFVSTASGMNQVSCGHLKRREVVKRISPPMRGNSGS